MSERAFVRHPDMPDVVKSVPAAAVGQLGASGWVTLEPAEVKAYEKRLVDEKAERLAALTGKPVPKKSAPKAGPAPQKKDEN